MIGTGFLTRFPRLVATMLLVGVVLIQALVPVQAQAAVFLDREASATEYMPPQDAQSVSSVLGDSTDLQYVNPEVGSWPMAGANPQRTSWSDADIDTDVVPHWYLPIEAYIPPKVQIIAANGLLYVSTSEGLYAIDAGSASLAWFYPTEMPLGNSPTIYEGVAYVGGFDRKIHAINAMTGQGLWTFTAGAGFDTNPLVIDGVLYAGNRDGSMYAIHVAGELAGQFKWKYETEGPVHYSAAYHNGLIYFASDDMHAYALDVNGQLAWKSDRLPGEGFHSWWPVIVDGQVVFSGSHAYRHRVYTYREPDLQDRDLEAIYPDHPTNPSGTPMGPVGTEAGPWTEGMLTMDASVVAEYLENHPWRRSVLVLDQATGIELTTDFDGDGQPEYAPFLWFGTHSGNRYPPIVEPTHETMYLSTNYRSAPYIVRGHIVGWDMGTANYGIATVAAVPTDESLAYVGGGSDIVWSHACDRSAGFFDLAIPNTRFDGSLDPQRESYYYSYNLASKVPDYDKIFTDAYVPNVGPGIYNSLNGVYSGSVGDQNPLIPYGGMLYQHRSNAIIAFGPRGEVSSPTCHDTLAMTATVGEPAASVDRSVLIDALEAEVSEMIAAGHLRPGYLHIGLWDQWGYPDSGERLVDMWHTSTDTIIALTQAYPLLSPALQSQVLDYLQSEIAAYPPYATQHTGWQGASREYFDIPQDIVPLLEAFGLNEVDSSSWTAWDVRPDAFYALSKYAALLSPAEAESLYLASKDHLELPPDNATLQKFPYVHNAYIAGYLGYLDLESLAGYAETTSVRDEYQRLLQLRVDTFDKDINLDESRADYFHVMGNTRQFLHLVPELGAYLAENALVSLTQALDEYQMASPYWFVSRFESGFWESGTELYYDVGALFQAKALILGESYDELTKVLDVPAFARGDLIYIQNLAAALNADGGEDPNPPPTGGPTISNVQLLTASPVPAYAKVEVSFDLNTVATNPYLPYDADTPVGVEPGIGVSVDLLALPPGETNWANAQTVAAFYYQPVETVGYGSQAALLPVGRAEWRARFSTGTEGGWQYKIQATDASGTTTSSVGEFTIASSDNHGYVEVSQTDTKMFEFSDGTPFAAPLVTAHGDLFGSLSTAQEYLPAFGENGVHLLRWFPTGENGLPLLAPFGDSIEDAWHFGAVFVTSTNPDTETGHLFSFRPYYYTVQSVAAVPGETYRLSFRAQVEGEWVLRAELGGLDSLDIGSADGTYHENNGSADACDVRQDGWHTYEIIAENVSATSLGIAMRGLYAANDGPMPYNNALEGYIRTNSIMLQRDETGNGDWGPNLLVRSDPDTYNYVDQRAAAQIDEVFRLSEEHDVYHKLTMFHKNDNILNRLLPDGTIATTFDGMNVPFYSAKGLRARWYEEAYTRYFLGRWGYSTSLHSLELANENHLSQESYQAGWDLAEYVHEHGPRNILMSNSFWGWFVSDFFDDATNGHLIDYADKHWYANVEESNQEVLSNTWDDSAAYMREAWESFDTIRASLSYDKPIMRGECGVAETGTMPQHPEIKLDPTGTYYHKAMWAHVGSPQYSLLGEWYPRFVDAPQPDQWPNESRNTMSVFAAYERYIAGEPINNGHYANIGTDLFGDAEIMANNVTGSLRAWGVRDAVHGRALMWIDNAGHTWKNVVDGVAVTPASADLTLQGLPAGNYNLAWWDTTLGAESSVETVTVAADGQLVLHVDSLMTDIALKLSYDGAPAPTATPTQLAPTDEPTPTSTPTAVPTVDPNADLTQGLVGYWPLDSGSATDLSGKANHGTLNGPTALGDAHLGGGLLFDGVDDNVEMADSASLDITGQLSIAAWVNPSAAGQSAASRVLSKRNETGGTDLYALGLWNYTTKPFFRLVTDSTTDLLSTTTIPMDTWSHVAAVYDGATMRIYINGIETDSMAKTGAVQTSSIALHLGDRTDEANNRRYAGGLDEVMLWERALDAAQVSDLYANGLTPPSVPTPTYTPQPTATYTPLPTATYTPQPTATYTPQPTATYTPQPTATYTPLPTATYTPQPTATYTPQPTATYTPLPTATSTPVPALRLNDLAPSQGPTTGGTSLTLSGVGFMAGAQVTLGGKPCADVIVVSDTQINCSSPEHDVAETVDAVVTNPGGASDTLTDAFTYTVARASLYLTSPKASLDEPVTVTLVGQSLNGVVAADIVITYDAMLLSAVQVTPVSLLSGWSIQSNLANPGEVRISMASGGSSLAGSGDLLEIEFILTDASQSSSLLSLNQANLNDGAIPCDAADYVMPINTKRTISGDVVYWSQSAPVKGAQVALVDGQDISVFSDMAGAYSLDTSSSAGCRLTVSKADDIDAISAYDAALVLQHAAGSIALDGHALLAADVNKSEAVSAMDAYYILQKAVDAISLPFPGAESVWEFAPGDYAYAAVDQNMADQDFVAVLIGDVSGNWGGTLGAMPMDTGASLSLNHGELEQGESVELDLVLVAGHEPVQSLDISITYDPGALSLSGVSTEGVAAEAQWSYHETEPGNLRIAGASGEAISEDGLLMRLAFELCPDAAPSIVSLQALANEGSIYIAPSDCPVSRSARPDRMVR